MNVQAQAQFLPAGRPLEAVTDIVETQQARVRRVTARVRADVALPLAIVAAMIVCAVAPGLVAPYSATAMDHDAILQAPGMAHLLGTDHLGRDVFSLVVHGARQSLLVAGAAVVIGLLLGGVLGLVSGYVGRWIDMAFMRLLEVWMSIPDILLVIVIATALTPSLTNTILTIGVVSAPRYARVMRSQVIALKHRPFVEASRAIGTSDLAILARHVLPHTLSPMLVLATLGVAGAALMAASLSFIGLGVVDDTPDWGYLLSQARGYLTVAWWFGAFPGLAITVLVISVNMLGDALRTRLDPRARTR